jgi:hypothetical protein
MPTQERRFTASRHRQGTPTLAIETRPIARLIPSIRNARTHPGLDNPS